MTEEAPRSNRNWPYNNSNNAMSWTALAYPTGMASTSAVGVEKGMPREVMLNQPFEYQIVVTNLTNETLTDVVVMDDPGDGMRLNGSDPAGEIQGGLAEWNLGSLGPGESKTIRVNATATSEGTVGTCAAVEYNSQLCATTAVVQPELQLTKTGPAEVMKCEEIQYKFVVTNSGTGTVRGVKINDPLPEGLMTASGGRNIMFDAGNLAPGQSREFMATVKADRKGRFENRATASGENDISAESGMVATTVREPVLTISKDCPENSFIGQQLNYTITVRNTGDGEARNTVVEDTIPANSTFVSASDGGRLVGGKVVWDLGTLAPNASKEVTMRVTAGSAGTYTNSVSARAFCAASVSDSCETEVTGIPAILLEVVDVSDPIRVGNNETYVITITNQGSAPDTNIQIVANLEGEQSYVSSSGPTNGTHRNRTITFDPIASLAPKAQATYRVVVKAEAPGDIRFEVRMTSDQLSRPVTEDEATNQYE